MSHNFWKTSLSRVGYIFTKVNIKKLALRMRQIQENKESKEVDDNNSPPNRKLNFRACESLLRYEQKHGQGILKILYFEYNIFKI